MRAVPRTTRAAILISRRRIVAPVLDPGRGAPEAVDAVVTRRVGTGERGRLLAAFAEDQDAGYVCGSGIDQAEAFAAINAFTQGLPPHAVVEVPLDGLAQAGLERLDGAPAELGLDLGRIDRIAAVVTRT